MYQTPALALVVASASLTSCTASWHAERADEEVLAELDFAQRGLDRQRRDTVVLPGSPRTVKRAEVVNRLGLEGDSAVLDSVVRDDESGAIVVDLRVALRIAVNFNREYKSSFESLYRQGLGFTLTRFSFGPQLDWAVSSIWSDAEAARTVESYRSDWSLDQILPTGGNLGFGASLTGTRDTSPGSQSIGSSVSVSLSQPLLRGAGYEPSHEAWTQAQRDLIYAVRDFELFRQQFAIDIAQRYFDLISQKKTLANEEDNYSQSVFDRKKAEGLYETDRQTEQEVFRARRRELLAENALVDARADFNRAVEQFKRELGLPIETVVQLAEEDPSFEPVRIDPLDAFEVARVNRLDLMTERQQIEDSERGVRLAKNGLLPDLNLTADYGLDGTGGALDRASPDDWSGSVGISLELPIQRLPERNSYQNSLITLRQSLRAYRQRLDQLEIDLSDRLRRLSSTQRQIELQRELIEQERRAVAVSEIRFEAGDLDNRDLLEARQALIDAQNALIRLQVSHFIGRLQLMRELGILFIDDNGMWE